MIARTINENADFFVESVAPILKIEFTEANLISRIAIILFLIRSTDRKTFVKALEMKLILKTIGTNVFCP